MTLKLDLLGAFLSSKKRLARIVARIVPGSEVEDILQEAYLRVHTATSQDDIREPVAYITQIAKHLAQDYVRSAEYRKSENAESDLIEALINEDNTHDHTLNTVLWKEELLHFFKAVESLPSKCQEVYILKKIYGYSQNEIALKLGISASAVEKHIAQGTKKLFHLMPLPTQVGQRLKSADVSTVAEVTRQ